MCVHTKKKEPFGWIDIFRSNDWPVQHVADWRKFKREILTLSEMVPIYKDGRKSKSLTTRGEIFWSRYARMCVCLCECIWAQPYVHIPPRTPYVCSILYYATYYTHHTVAKSFLQLCFSFYSFFYAFEKCQFLIYVPFHTSHMFCMALLSEK